MTVERLDIIATGQDRATAVLRSVNAELTKTSDKLRQLDQRPAQVGQLSDRAAALRDERARRVAAMAEDQKRLAALERETAAAGRPELAQKAGLYDRLQQRVGAASRTQELFNKTLGLAGFAGLAVGALAAIAQLIESWSDYGEAAAVVNATQERFLELLRAIADQNFQDRLAGMTKEQRAQAEAARQIEERQDQYVELQQRRLEREDLLTENIRRQEALWVSMLTGNTKAALQLDALQKEEARLRSEITLSRERESELAGHTNRLILENSTEYRQIVALAQQWEAATARTRTTFDGIGTSLRGIATDIGAAFSQVADRAVAGIVEDAKARELEAKRRAAAGAAAHRAALARAAAEAEAWRRTWEKVADDVETKIRAVLEGEQREADRQNALRGELELLRARNEEELATIRLRQELARIQTSVERDDMSPEVARLEIEKERLEFEQERSRFRLQAIAETGAALEEGAQQIAEYESRLAGLAPAIAESTKLFTLFEQGQLSTKAAVLGGISVAGQLTAGLAKNKKEQAWHTGMIHQIEALGSLAFGDVRGFIQHQATAIAAFAYAGRGGGGKGGGGARSGSESGSSAGRQGGASYAEQLGADQRQIIMVAFPNGITYGTSGEVAKQAEQAANHLDGTGMRERRF